MTNAQPTAGPWGIELTDTAQWIGPMRPDGEKINDIVCKVDWDNGYTDEAKQRLLANALLIASAPELLVALETMCDDAESVARDSFATVEGPFGADWETEDPAGYAVWLKAKSVIAKTKGYATEHPVGNNVAIVANAQELLAKVDGGAV